MLSSPIFKVARAALALATGNEPDPSVFVYAIR
jgi:hypothetical protein